MLPHGRGNVVKSEESEVNGKDYGGENPVEVSEGLVSEDRGTHFVTCGRGRAMRGM